jgi:LAO/AO transport system kinase
MTQSAKDYIDGVLGGDRTVLARAITLVESSAPAHQALAREVLEGCLPRAGGSLRVGITGSPGVGKSCLIEALGSHLTGEHARSVAVLAVDPSSTVTRGSILGDKTRMTQLAADPRAFIRPSPSSGSLGGVARKTREAMLLCEAAGFEVVLVETVGVGQSEVEVRSMVDVFLLLLLAGAGDELQGIKRGVIELADALVVTKADGDNVARAGQARAQFAEAVHFLTPATEGWEVPALTCSSVTGEGIAELWQTVESFRAHAESNGALERRRRQQALHWMRQIISRRLELDFYARPAVKQLLPELEAAVEEGRLPAAAAAARLLDAGARDRGPTRDGTCEQLGD